MSNSLPRIPSELLSAFETRKCGLFVGAGVSRAAGLPDWKGLLTELVERVKRLPITKPHLVGDLKRLLKDPTKALVLATILKDELGVEFTKYIEERFSKDGNLAPSPLHTELVSLPAEFVITTNYDSLLESAYARMHKGDKILNPLTYRHAGEVASHLHRNRYFLLKAHGDAALDPDEVILTERDYRRIIYREPGYQSLLQTLFTTFTILFVGVSFTDIELNLLLSFIHSSFHGKTPSHYALVPEENPNPTLLDSWRKEFNINVIAISPGRNYENILKFVRKLKASL
jgi:hypothetical protein